MLHADKHADYGMSPCVQHHSADLFDCDALLTRAHADWPRACMLQDVKEQRKMGDLCTNFLLEKCTFGDRCKFNHDIQG